MWCNDAEAESYDSIRRVRRQSRLIALRCLSSAGQAACVSIVSVPGELVTSTTAIFSQSSQYTVIFLLFGIITDSVA